MAKTAPAALVAALLVATAVAFVYTEKLKLTPTPIRGTRVDKVFSPVCDCDTDTAAISFRLRRGDVVSLEIIDRGGTLVRELVRARREPAGRATYTWDGRDDAGGVVPEGAYRPRVRLQRERRTIVLPNRIRVDVTPPRVQLRSIRPRVFSPDGDRRADRVVVSYRVDEPARAILYVDGRRHTVTYRKPLEGTVVWNGSVDGGTAPRGVHRLAVGARDTAGNLAVRTTPSLVVIRYVALGRKRIETAPGARFAVLVSSDARVVDWKLGARRGLARPGTLRLRAPVVPGRYTLTVTANGHSVRAAVFVREVRGQEGRGQDES